MSEFNRIDISAMVLSGLCLVHCLALPLLVVLIPVGALYGLEDEHFHWVMLLLALPLSLASLSHGFLRHQRRFVPVIGGVGLALMAWDLLPTVEAHSHGHGLTIPGVFLVAVAHGLNIRALRRVAHDEG